MTQINVVADVSDYQIAPDFQMARNELVGVIVKATEGIKGQYQSQKNYADKIAKARAAGLLVGSYHFGRPGSGVDQAKYFLDTVGTTSGQLLALDCEGIYRNKTLVPSLCMTLRGAQDFVSYIKDQTGNWPGIYCGNDYLIPLMNGKKDGILSNCWLWLADYNAAPAWPKTVWQNCTLWQYTGDGLGPEPHKVAGIGDNIDRNIYFAGVDELRTFWNSGGAVRPAVETISTVANIQTALNKSVEPSPNLPVDGNYGPATAVAVAAFQTAQNLDVDGWVGPETMTALASLPVGAARPATPWMDWMRSHVGEIQMTGARPTAFTIKIFSHTTYPPLTDYTPESCAATVCAALEETDYKSTRSAAAASYINYGSACQLTPGCIVVYQWPDGGHHVDFCDEIIDANTVRGLGGNQGHQLNDTNFASKYIVSTRWPVK